MASPNLGVLAIGCPLLFLPTVMLPNAEQYLEILRLGNVSVGKVISPNTGIASSRTVRVPDVCWLSNSSFMHFSSCEFHSLDQET